MARWNIRCCGHESARNLERSPVIGQVDCPKVLAVTGIVRKRGQSSNSYFKFFLNPFQIAS